jgi:hypothetical protein
VTLYTSTLLLISYLLKSQQSSEVAASPEHLPDLPLSAPTPPTAAIHHQSQTVQEVPTSFIHGDIDTTLLNAGMRGIDIQPPTPPTNCCMSGCAHCVWDCYADEMSIYQAEIKKRRLRRRSEMVAHAVDVERASRGSNEGDVENEGRTDEDMAEIHVDPGMKAFLVLER